jgi:hypothetical protein
MTKKLKNSSIAALTRSACNQKILHIYASVCEYEFNGTAVFEDLDAVQQGRGGRTLRIGTAETKRAGAAEPTGSGSINEVTVRFNTTVHSGSIRG